MGKTVKDNLNQYRLSVLFLITRFAIILSVPLEGLKSYGDFWNFYHLASLGRPYWDMWLEFPPFFPFLSRGIFLVVGGREHSYIYALIILFSFIQAANVFLFQKIASAVYSGKELESRVLFYVFLIVGVFYSWAYFDTLAVFTLLLGLHLLINKKTWSASLLIGIGGTIKWFPLLIIPAAWKWLGPRKGLKVLLVSALILGITWGFLFSVSPEFTQASLVSQGAKGSWESVWAVIDGNLGTGNFGQAADRLIASSASIPTGNPARIPSWATLVVFGAIGYAVFRKLQLSEERQLLAFSGFTLMIFFLWSPGYSPQWCLFLLPLVILSFEPIRGQLLAGVLLLVNLLEWPILLSRGLFQFLEEIILLRTGIFVLLAVLFAQTALVNVRQEKGKIGSYQEL